MSSLITIQNLHIHCDPEKLDRILRNQETIMATLDQVLSDVTDESTQLDSLSTLITGLKQQLADALSGINLPAPVQAKVDAIFTQAEANRDKLATALNANTPAANVNPTGDGATTGA